jgi:hypothetical protein
MIFVALYCPEDKVQVPKHHHLTLAYLFSCTVHSSLPHT